MPQALPWAQQAPLTQVSPLAQQDPLQQASFSSVPQLVPSVAVTHWFPLHVWQVPQSVVLQHVPPAIQLPLQQMPLLPPTVQVVVVSVSLTHVFVVVSQVWQFEQQVLPQALAVGQHAPLTQVVPASQQTPSQQTCVRLTPQLVSSPAVPHW